MPRTLPRPAEPISKPRRFGSAEFIIVSVLLVGLGGYVLMVAEFGVATSKYSRGAVGQMKELEKAARMYQLEVGRLPRSLEELLKPVGVHEEGLLLEIPTDPWGHEFIYEPAGGTKRPYLILSPGEDGIRGTDDDLSTEFLPGRDD